MKTAEGAVDYSAYQIRDTPKPFISGVRAALSGRTRELEQRRSNFTRAACRRATSREHVHRRYGQTASVAGGGE